MAQIEEEQRWLSSLKAAGYDLYGVDWRDSEEMRDIYQLLSITAGGAKSRVKAMLRRYDNPVFQVTASIGNARNVKGFRAAVYLMAEESKAFSVESGGGARPIRYATVTSDAQEGHTAATTLIVSLYFISQESAMTFATKLRNWKFNHPLVASSLEDPVLDEIPRRLPGRTDLRPVLLQHYDPSEAQDSPCTSLADFRGVPSSLATEPVALTEPLWKYQSIESDASFAVRMPYKLHIKDKARFKGLRDNENNMLAGSWTFHQLFDGLNTAEGHLVPLLAIRWLGCDPNVTQFPDGERRFKVELLIEFFMDAAEADLAGSLKVCFTKVSDRNWKVFVYVCDTETFKECIDWKYTQANQIWNDHLVV